ncbi:hypothetical protein BD309DRAFT_964457 [Dichomitus squalens]|uniref:Uncharacterized protein n=1 Tax=Dichomitus squalens TaxID=114155 RepID=A0A4Q9M6E7_9APHY|nr:hypothetical protein BD311DRAFT_705309 [Dichomitus squalens]TBU41824.1 hypothetical protein BD309DRAFT_964457 [Dichomitus squalens]
MLQYPCHSLSITLFLFASSFTSVATIIVDDWNQGIQWNGAWESIGDQPAPTWDGSLHWGNLSGSTATYTFAGTSIQVVGALKPVGTWSMESQYTIDGGDPTVFTPPSEVSQEAYAQTFFDSGPLPAGEHTLLITNLGAQLWIDCLRVSNDTVSSNTSSQGQIDIGGSHSTTTSQSSSTTTSPRPTSSSSTRPRAESTLSATRTSTSTPVKLINSTSTVTIPPSLSSSASSVFESSSQLPSSSATSLSASSTTQASEMTPTHSPESTRPRSNGLVIGLVVALVAVLGTLLGTVCWYRRRRSRNLTPVQPYFFFSSDAMIQPVSQPSVLDEKVHHSLSSATPNLRSAPEPLASSSMSYIGGHSDVDVRRLSQASAQWSVDGGIRIAGGPHGGDAPSIASRQSLKDKFPPPYQTYPSA